MKTFILKEDFEQYKKGQEFISSLHDPVNFLIVGKISTKLTSIPIELLKEKNIYEIIENLDEHNYKRYLQ